MAIKVLITGGYGFISRNLGEQLIDDFQITKVNRQQLDLLDSVAVNDFLKTGRYDVVVHGATYDAAPIHSNKDPQLVLENNLRMFFNIARADSYFGKMIYFGSGAEYSREHWIPKMTEEYFDTFVPKDQYGLSKYIMTKYAHNNKKILNLRLFAVFGRYEDWKVRLISSICMQALRGSTINIKQNKYYDFMYIDDLVKIVKWFIINNPKENIYNICSGSVIDFVSIAKMICKLSSNKIKILLDNNQLGAEYSGDNSLFLNEIGSYHFEDINLSIDKLYNWYKDNS